MLRRRLVLTIALAVLGALATGSAQAAPPYFKTLANVEGGDRDEDGNSWFETWDNGMRFVLEAKHAEHSETLWTLLQTSYQHGLAASVIFDASAARFDAKLDRIVYPICSVEVSGQKFISPRPCDKPAYQPKSQVDEVAFALGEFVSGSPKATIARLNRILVASSLKPGILKIALMARAQSYEDISDNELPESKEADRASVAAMADYRRLSELEPNTPYFQYKIGLMLQDLGDYGAARAVFNRVKELSPEDDFNNTLSLATLERESGNAAASLKLLDGLVERNGRQDDMRYNYHRGWTLNALERYDEAIAVLNAGIKDQPDYAYAYLRRACAFAAVARLGDAIHDLESAGRFLSAVPQAEADRSVLADLARAEALTATLQAAIAAGELTPHPEVCHGYWGDDGHPRQRSSLLPG
jgi:tetratricopeptide (TPR) repeat protein